MAAMCGLFIYGVGDVVRVQFSFAFLVSALPIHAFEPLRPSRSVKDSSPVPFAGFTGILFGGNGIPV